MFSTLVTAMAIPCHTCTQSTEHILEHTKKIPFHNINKGRALELSKHSLLI